MSAFLRGIAGNIAAIIAMFRLFTLGYSSISMFQLPLLDVYNPFVMKSNLFKFIVSKTIKNSSSSRGNKRKFQAPQVIQTCFYILFYIYCYTTYYTFRGLTKPVLDEKAKILPKAAIRLLDPCPTFLKGGCSSLD